MCSLLLKYAATVVIQNCIIIIYVILFIIATAVVFALGYFQALSFLEGNLHNPGIFGKIMVSIVMF